MNKKVLTLMMFSMLTVSLYSQNNDSIAQVIAEGKKAR